MLTIDNAIALLTAARQTLPMGGSSLLILSLTGSQLEDVEVSEMVVKGEEGSSYVEMRATHPSLNDDGETSSININWGVDDVLEIREDLTQEQAMEVLYAAKREHDASIGINWNVLETHADMMFPKQ